MKGAMMKVSIEPADGPVGVTTQVLVDGVPQGEQVSVALMVHDADGNAWRSEERCSVGANGEVGDDRLWWDMHWESQAQPDAVPVAFRLNDQPLNYTIEVVAASGSDTAMCRRLWNVGSPPEHIGCDGYSLTVYRPLTTAGHTSGAGSDAAHPAILVVPGTTGPAGLGAVAALLAIHGFVAAVLTYMGEPGMPASFKELPVERFNAALISLGGLSGVDADRVAVYAVSVGTIPAAYSLTLPDAPKVKALVLVAGSSHVWRAQRVRSTSEGLMSDARRTAGRLRPRARGKVDWPNIQVEDCTSAEPPSGFPGVDPSAGVPGRLTGQACR